ncbi:hypothetical protein P154DRAFT_583542 [Amniculicola lignicola CBS 123094]|uniref:Uncharacterized protein n=1 Tax=Amniculicola lignicola CBS 123094 TaxID=1392246 RepID=A0A6A5VTB0_9PLEO|nr:hypothetical protein P154DRAFT_583542 [Amniculicola lignicola CBS 123094]
MKLPPNGKIGTVPFTKATQTQAASNTPPNRYQATGLSTHGGKTIDTAIEGNPGGFIKAFEQFVRVCKEDGSYRSSGDNSEGDSEAEEKSGDGDDISGHGSSYSDDGGDDGGKRLSPPTVPRPAALGRFSQQFEIPLEHLDKLPELLNQDRSLTEDVSEDDSSEYLSEDSIDAAGSPPTRVAANTPSTRRTRIAWDPRGLCNINTNLPLQQDDAS